MKKIIAGVFIISVYGCLTYYLGWNIKSWLQSFGLFHYPLLFWCVLFTMSFSIIIGRLHEMFRWFSIVGNYWMFIFQYGLLLSLISQLLRWVTPLEERQIGSIVVIIMLILLVVGTYLAYSPVVKRLAISMDKKESRLDTLRVVVASDFHLGVLANKSHLQRFVNLSNAAKPDVVLLVGDIVDDDPKWYVTGGMAEVMKQLTSTYGNYGVLGNHEYYGKEIPKFIEEMKSSGVQILCDETIRIADAFYITGREDRTNKNRLKLNEMRPQNNNLPWFVMNHTPDDLQTPMNEGVDFHTSGHTHKGQMWPNGFITGRIFEVDYGYKQKEQMHALVSSGFGFWGPPIRIGSRSELWVVDITFK
ncbi:MAG: metallophosphoesterase [Lysinibacillus sp.]